MSLLPHKLGAGCSTLLCAETQSTNHQPCISTSKSGPRVKESNRFLVVNWAGEDCGCVRAKIHALPVMCWQSLMEPSFKMKPEFEPVYKRQCRQSLSQPFSSCLNLKWCLQFQMVPTMGSEQLQRALVLPSLSEDEVVCEDPTLSPEKLFK